MISRLPRHLFHTFWRAAAQSKWFAPRLRAAPHFAFACCALRMCIFFCIQSRSSMLLCLSMLLYLWFGRLVMCSCSCGLSVWHWKGRGTDYHHNSWEEESASHPTSLLLVKSECCKLTIISHMDASTNYLENYETILFRSDDEKWS